MVSACVPFGRTADWKKSWLRCTSAVSVAVKRVFAPPSILYSEAGGLGTVLVFGGMVPKTLMLVPDSIKTAR